MKLTRWLIVAETRFLFLRVRSVGFFFTFLFIPSPLGRLGPQQDAEMEQTGSEASLDDRCARTDETTSMAFQGLDPRDV